MIEKINPISLFSDYMKVVGTPSLSFDDAPDPRLQGKKLGVVNGSNWVSLWSDWFGHKHLPGVKIVNIGNEAVQLNFMTAHSAGLPVPPQINIDCFCRYAEDLVNLYHVDAIMISCSTMNRAYEEVARRVQPYGVPVIQIDQEMMERAVDRGGKILVIATHGPTVSSTTALLKETALAKNRDVDFCGSTIEDAFELLGEGRIEDHNERIADAIRAAQAKYDISSVVLAQMSMAVFSFTHPDPEKEFGIPVYNSADTGFERAARILAEKA